MYPRSVGHFDSHINFFLPLIPLNSSGPKVSFQLRLRVEIPNEMIQKMTSTGNMTMQDVSCHIIFLLLWRVKADTMTGGTIMMKIYKVDMKVSDKSINKRQVWRLGQSKWPFYACSSCDFSRFLSKNMQINTQGWLETSCLKVLVWMNGVCVCPVMGCWPVWCVFPLCALWELRDAPAVPHDQWISGQLHILWMLHNIILQ